MDYSRKRKELQKKGLAPSWYTTGGFQLLSEKYLSKGETPFDRYKAIARALAQHMPGTYPLWWAYDPYTSGKDWETVFFNSMWDAYISPSTPLLSNGGNRKKGTTVSCAGGLIDNNLYDRYNAMTEAAILTKHSHGTSYAINWPAEGDSLGRGGHSAGVLPVIRDFVNTMDEVVQGTRRGSLAYSLDIRHGDFQEVLNHLYENPESNNLGWLIKDEFVRDWVDLRTEDACSRMGKALGVKMIKGRGYFTFIDKMNRHRAQAFKNAGLEIKASNLCQETVLPASDQYTFSCVILNVNLELYDSLPEHIFEIAHIMNDCNVSEYIATIDELSYQDQLAMKKIRRFSKDFRSVGTGVLGWHTLMQRRRIVVGSLECFMLDEEIFSRMNAKTLEASQWLAELLGEPEGCKGLGIRNATRMMMPPTKSTAEIMAGASEGIGLDLSMVFTTQSAGGEIFRVNKVLLEIMKERGVYTDEKIMEIAKARTVANQDWLTEHEKKVFRCAFEVPMDSYLDLCSNRQPKIDQGQSLNLYLTSKDDESYISYLHAKAFKDENCLSLYYIYSMRDTGEITRSTECVACM
jgi:ribonucleoside-diphosphate reductase alpha chain